MSGGSDELRHRSTAVDQGDSSIGSILEKRSLGVDAKRVVQRGEDLIGSGPGARRDARLGGWCGRLPVPSSSHPGEQAGTDVGPVVSAGIPVDSRGAAELPPKQ